MRVTGPNYPCRSPLFSGIATLLCLVGIGLPAWAQFETRTTFAIPGESFAVAVGDFNRDGKLDVAVPAGDSLTIYLGNGDGTFKQGASYSGVFDWIAVADFNNDGIADIVVSDAGGVEVFLGNGDGTFQPPVSSPTTYSVDSIAVGDFNGDHKMDIVVIDYTDISVLLGNGDGTFQPAIDNSTFVGPHELAVGDFNNDHKLDVAVVGYFGGSQDLGVLLGNGDGTLQSSLTYPLNYVPASVAAADFNNDGNVDVAVGGYISTEVMVLLGNGNGGFGAEADYSGGTGLVFVGDFNRDGKLDLIVTPEAGGVAEFLGNGDGTFQPARVSLSGLGGGVAAAGDFNNDHQPDALLLDMHKETMTTMLNTGALTFSPSSPLNFPAQLIDTTSSPKTVQLTNTWASTVSISSVKASGPFQITNSCGSEIAAGDNCTVSATFTPSKAGHQSGSITLLDSASSKLQFIELEGAGTPIKLSPASVSFGSQKVGTKSTPKIVTVTNEGTRSVIDKSVTITGADTSDFSEADDCAGHSILPGGTCKVNVTFAPKKTGARTARLYVNLQGMVGPRPVPLSGTGD